MKFPSFTSVLPIDIWVLKSDDKRLQNFKSANVPFIEPCFGVIDDFFPRDVAIVFVQKVFFDSIIL